MKVLTTAAELGAALDGPRRSGRRIGLVPTMGALHEGHGSLVLTARKRADIVVATVFVNPTQFGPAEDLARYPRDDEGDRAKLAAWGADYVFRPSPLEIYPEGLEGVRIVPPAHLLRGLCAPARPVHFPGVLTVVLKLFNLVRPRLAFFGQKDFQQWRVIDHMARDLLLGVEIVRCPTVREDDGLALSSRNAYLAPPDRDRARCLSQALSAALTLFEHGERQTEPLLAAAQDSWERSWDGPAGALEYLEVVDGQTLAPVPTLTGEAVAAVAARVGPARLIDNVVLAPDSPDLGLLGRMRGSRFSFLA